MMISLRPAIKDSKCTWLNDYRSYDGAPDRRPPSEPDFIEGRIPESSQTSKTGRAFHLLSLSLSTSEERCRRLWLTVLRTA